MPQIFSMLEQVIFEEGYEEYIDKVIILGFADSTGDDEADQSLAEARAEAVDDYCSEMDSELAWITDTAEGNSNYSAYQKNAVGFLITLDAEVFMDE